MSDTHKNEEMIKAMAKKALDYDATIHLGDDYQDGDFFVFEELPIIRVPGTWGTEYQDPMIENRRFEYFLNWTLFLSHTPHLDPHDLPDDIDPKDVVDNGQCDIFLHGHTHIPNVTLVNNVLIVNPGHLKALESRGQKASYGQIEISDNALKVQIFDFESNQPMFQHTLNR